MAIGWQGRIGVALLVIVVTFAFMGYLSYNHFTLTSKFQTNSQSIIDSSDMDDETKLLKINELHKDVETSNLTFTNIIFPILATWVGVIIAFYFTSEASNKERDAMKKSQDKQMNLLESAMLKQIPQKTLAEILNIYKHRKDPIISELDDILSKVIKDATWHGNTVLVKNKREKNTQENILGILYSKDISKMIESLDPKNLGNITLEDKIDKITDTLTNQPWDKDGISNYATLMLADTNLIARERMKKISDTDETKGLVFDNNGILFGIVGYATISMAEGG